MAAVAKYCDEYVCVCVRMCVREDIYGTTCVTFTKFFVHVATGPLYGLSAGVRSRLDPCPQKTNKRMNAYGRDSVLLRRCCDMLCTSGFVDDMF